MKITVAIELDAEEAAAVHEAALERGMSVANFVAGSIEVGSDAIAADDCRVVVEEADEVTSRH